MSPSAQSSPDRRRRLALLAIAAAAAIAAVLVAVLSSDGGGWHDKGRQGSIATGPTVVQLAASYLHVPPAEVRRGLAQGKTLAQIAAEKGSSRKSLLAAIYNREAEQIKSRHLSRELEQRELAATRAVLAERLATARIASLRVTAASYLGLTRAQLRAKLAGGDTLASLATAKGRSPSGLIEAMIGPRREAIERARKDGRLPAATAKRRLDRLRTKAERLVDQRSG